MTVAGSTRKAMLEGRRGDGPELDGVLTEGRWMRRAGEVVAGTAWLRQSGVRVGDDVRLRKGDRSEEVTVVGAFMESNGELLVADWPTFTALAPEEKPIAYHVKLRDGTDPAAYARAAAAADPGVSPAVTGPNAITQTVVGSASVLTAMLAVVASLGVFNTVVLNTRDRRRDLGMLKSIGMTPRQVTVMMTTSMAALGALGSALGVLLGIWGYRQVVPRMVDAVDLTLPVHDGRLAPRP